VAVTSDRADKAEAVCVCDYDPQWPERFRILAERMKTALGGLAIAVEHVGSTAVPGLAAKPVVDFDLVVRREDLPRAIELLRSLGYVHEGDRGVAGREAFRWPPGEERHHLYICGPESTAMRRHLLFRDHLRAHPAAARAYADLKRMLAQRHATDREAYQHAKAVFIEAVTQAAAEAERNKGSVGQASHAQRDHAGQP
jgi:GrpB-like predicted nucleotidyltransferase (UPF0157 family)